MAIDEVGHLKRILIMIGFSVLSFLMFGCQNYEETHPFEYTLSLSNIDNFFDVKTQITSNGGKSYTVKLNFEEKRDFFYYDQLSFDLIFYVKVKDDYGYVYHKFEESIQLKRILSFSYRGTHFANITDISYYNATLVNIKGSIRSPYEMNLKENEYFFNEPEIMPHPLELINVSQTKNRNYLDEIESKLDSMSVDMNLFMKSEGTTTVSLKKDDIWFVTSTDTFTHYSADPFYYATHDGVNTSVYQYVDDRLFKYAWGPFNSDAMGISFTVDPEIASEEDFNNGVNPLGTLDLKKTLITKSDDTYRVCTELEQLISEKEKKEFIQQIRSMGLSWDKVSKSMSCIEFEFEQDAIQIKTILDFDATSIDIEHLQMVHEQTVTSQTFTPIDVHQHERLRIMSPTSFDKITQVSEVGSLQKGYAGFTPTSNFYQYELTPGQYWIESRHGVPIFNYYDANHNQIYLNPTDNGIHPISNPYLETIIVKESGTYFIEVPDVINDYSFTLIALSTSTTPGVNQESIELAEGSQTIEFEKAYDLVELTIDSNPSVFFEMRTSSNYEIYYILIDEEGRHLRLNPNTDSVVFIRLYEHSRLYLYGKNIPGEIQIDLEVKLYELDTYIAEEIESMHVLTENPLEDPIFIGKEYLPSYLKVEVTSLMALTIHLNASFGSDYVKISYRYEDENEFVEQIGYAYTRIVRQGTLIVRFSCDEGNAIIKPSITSIIAEPIQNITLKPFINANAQPSIRTNFFGIDYIHTYVFTLTEISLVYLRTTQDGKLFTENGVLLSYDVLESSGSTDSIYELSPGTYHYRVQSHSANFSYDFIAIGLYTGTMTDESHLGNMPKTEIVNQQTYTFVRHYINDVDVLRLNVLESKMYGFALTNGYLMIMNTETMSLVKMLIQSDNVTLDPGTYDLLFVVENSNQGSLKVSHQAG
jgi:hypothetical protein